MSAFEQIESQIKTLEEQISHILSLKEKEVSKELKDLYQEEVTKLTHEVEALKQSLEMVVGNNGNEGTVEEGTDGKIKENQAILEIRPGTGGDEAALFAGELVNMYRRFAEKSHWKQDVINLSEGNAGGVRIATIELKGPKAYELLKNESGVHRVQRVPITEAGGRTHTSTATVAVLPVIEQTEIEVKPDDLKWDFFRAGGHGGQNVNKVSTAVRLTHIPTGVIIECQEERFQGKNREKALQILKSKLYSEMQAQHVGNISQIRAGQVGTGERVEKIRTYNFPQDRITDHRVKQSWHNIPSILNGNIEDILTSTVGL